MKRRRFIICAALAVIVAGVFVWAKSRPPPDLTRVTMGFAGFEMVKGKRMAMFCVTNGSDTKIIHPLIQTIGGDPIELGASQTLFWANDIGFVNGCVGIVSGWNSNDFLPPRPWGIAPGEVYLAYVEPPDGFSTWLVKAYFQTIPFRHRLPRVLESCWPSSPNDDPVNFALKPSRIDLIHGRSVDNLPSKWELSNAKISD